MFLDVSGCVEFKYDFKLFFQFFSIFKMNLKNVWD